MDYLNAKYGAFALKWKYIYCYLLIPIPKFKVQESITYTMTIYGETFYDRQSDGYYYVLVRFWVLYTETKVK